MINSEKANARYHLPGLFEFYEFYKVFLPIYFEHREFFYDWAEIASIYGSPSDCIWGGGRFGMGENNAVQVMKLLQEYNISARLTFSNSLLKEEHLSDIKCNKLCELFSDTKNVKNGVIIYSELLLEYIKKNYPNLYFVSSTTKVITDFDEFTAELKREDFSYVVPDFRLNKHMDRLNALEANLKSKVEFLCNECCYAGCTDRKVCYESVSRRIIDETCPEFICRSPGGNKGYIFSEAMKNPLFIGIEDIKNVYLPNGFTNFKIEGRTLGSALLLEFLLYYMVKPEYQLKIREMTYLDSTLDLF